ncbi:PaaI family thioesterase [Paenisporosarcina sp. OV554]|uniref:PaaI family thioesterase n=1 Tax=Paenisporosarcina sp. OV554 TaxID=2135694 RepID=UPI000D34287E|nr:PaaI family thioesterase [Paenisporosarcina sp. OV554]PUB18065.1 uncharacterized protein (TIGR00369 family) [Paenisporosarcina sp. OV554]
MKELLVTQFQQIISNSTEEDLSILSNWMDGFEKKQRGEKSTYLSAGLHMERSLTDDFCKVSIPITPLIHNNLSIPHGGIIGVLLDTAMGVLANNSLPEDRAAVTTNLSVTYLATATEGHLHAHATISHKGRQTIVATGEVTDDQGKLLAIGTGSFFVIQRSR